MEILGSSISNLQSAISSGLESVTTGITQSSVTAGPSALGIAQESFSFIDVASDGAMDLPVVAAGAGYPSPKDYFGKMQQRSLETESPIPTQQIKDTLIDPNFRIDASLSDFVSGATNQLGGILKQERQWTPGEWLNGVHNQPAAPDPIGDLYGEVLNRKIDQPANSSMLKEQINPYAAEEVKNRSGVPTGDPTSIVTNRPSILGAAPTQSIDETLVLLQQDPVPQSMDIFTQQLGAVQDMIATADNTVQLQKNLASNFLLGGLRV
jgi:hypothetical protein